MLIRAKPNGYFENIDDDRQEDNSSRYLQCLYMLIQYSITFQKTNTIEQKSFPNQKQKTKKKKQKSKAMFVTLAQTQQSTHMIEQKSFPNKKKTKIKSHICYTYTRSNTTKHTLYVFLYIFSFNCISTYIFKHIFLIVFKYVYQTPQEYL